MQEIHKIKKNLFIFFSTLMLLNGCSNPIDQSKQNQLIVQNEIRIGMNCKNLTELLGGYRAITYLYLEKKDQVPSLANSYLLLSTASKDLNKNYFLCERTRDNYIHIKQKIKKHIYDYDLIKLYKNQTLMMKHVLSVSSEYTRMHILGRVNLYDYNLTRQEVGKILDEIVELEQKKLDLEAKKADEILKEEIKKEKINIPEDEYQKELRKKILGEMNNE